LPRGRAYRAALADRYVIERESGAGGMATVYLACDVRQDRKVALKVLRPERGEARAGGPSSHAAAPLANRGASSTVSGPAVSPSHRAVT
jgi:serine/threonine protein kinase